MLWFLPLFAATVASGDELELVRRLKSREPQAMADLYDRYGRLIYALIYRIVRNTAAAEDLMQETFLRIWNRVQAFDQDRGALGPWVLTVARNRAIDYLRSVDGRMAQNFFEVERLEDPALFRDFETDLLNRDRAQRLHAAFEKLTPNQRVALELAYFEGLSQTEMAERMKQPLGTVKTWVRTGLKTLREHVAKTAQA